MLDQREIATVDDEDYVHFFVCQILGALKKGNLSDLQSSVPFQPPMATFNPGAATAFSSVFFVDTGDPERRSK